MSGTFSLPQEVKTSDETSPVTSATTSRRSRAWTAKALSSSSTTVNTISEIKDRDENGQTPLHVAAGKGNSAAVKLLLRNGAEKEARDCRRQIPLHLAAGNGDVDTVVKLLGSGLNAADKNGQTPLHVAARNGKHKIVQLLIDEGAEMEVHTMDLRTPLHVAASYGKSEVVKVLVREGANRAAKDNNHQNPLHLAAENGDSDTILELLDRNVSKAPPPRTTIDYQLYARKFINDYLPKFTGFGDTYVKDLAQTATVRVKEAASKWGLSEETAAGLIKLALYDFVLLCDDSTSMAQADRKQMLEYTLRQVATFATVLEPAGITMRFINHPTDSTFSKMVDVGGIMEKVKRVGFCGDTKLGTVLDRKIIQPMIVEKAEGGTLKKPVIVVIITDGEPSEHPGILSDAIYNCKTNSAVKACGDAAVVFLISQVGDSENATEFLRDLEDDRRVGGMVYCSTDRLDELNRRAQGGGSDRTYIAQLIKLFTAAIDHHISGHADRGVRKKTSIVSSSVYSYDLDSPFQPSR